MPAGAEVTQTSVVLRSYSWHFAGLLVGFFLLLIGVLYQDTVSYLVSIWNQLETGEFAHGYLVLAISVYLVIRDRGKLAAISAMPNYWGLVAIAASGFFWMLGAISDVMLLQAVFLVFLILATVWAALGSQATKILMLPVLFIFFAIPVWSLLSPLLQVFTLDVVYKLIRLLGVPALREQQNIILPAGQLAIEGACSGLRYLLAALTLGVLYAYLNYSRLRSRVIVVAVCAAVAILANLLRVFIVVYLGYTSDMQHPYIYDHLNLGWILFGVMVFTLLIIDVRLSRRRNRQHKAFSNKTGAKNSETKIANVQKNDISLGGLQSNSVATVSAITLGTLVTLSFGPALTYKMQNQMGVMAESVSFELPTIDTQWKGPAKSEFDWTPQYQGAVNRKATYVNKELNRDKTIYLYVAYYLAQHQGSELINDRNNIGNGGIWKTSYMRNRVIKRKSNNVLEQSLRNTLGQRRLVWYWYQVAGYSTSSGYIAKLLQAWGVLTGNTHAAMVAVAIDYDENVSDSRDDLSSFLGVAQSRIIHLLGNEI